MAHLEPHSCTPQLKVRQEGCKGVKVNSHLFFVLHRHKAEKIIIVLNLLVLLLTISQLC